MKHIPEDWIFQDIDILVLSTNRYENLKYQSFFKLVFYGKWMNCSYRGYAVYLLYEVIQYNFTTFAKSSYLSGLIQNDPRNFFPTKCKWPPVDNRNINECIDTS